MTDKTKQEEIRKLREIREELGNRINALVCRSSFTIKDLDSIFETVLSGLKIDTGEPENPYHSDQCSDNLNPQAGCFSEGVKAARAKFKSIGEIVKGE